MNQINNIYNTINKSIDLINSFNIEIPDKLRFGPTYDINDGCTDDEYNIDYDIIYMNLYIIQLKKWSEELDTILYNEFC